MWQAESCSNRGQGSSTTIKPSATLWGHGYPRRSWELHLCTLFGWRCRAQHETEFTSANLLSNLMHAWSSGSNQFSAFTVWWIWPMSHDSGPSCYKYGHAFSSVYKKFRHNPKSWCIKHQTRMGLLVWTVMYTMHTNTQLCTGLTLVRNILTSICRHLMHHSFT